MSSRPTKYTPPARTEYVNERIPDLHIVREFERHQPPDVPGLDETHSIVSGFAWALPALLAFAALLKACGGVA